MTNSSLSSTPQGGQPFEVVALVASAGGLEAISAVLRGLSEDFPATVVVAQHLGGQGSTLVSILQRRTPLPVRWAEEGTEIRPGEILVCPARHCLEILPDRTCALSPSERGAHDRPLDGLLRSLAHSLGERALGVVLTGMGSDGAAGALALREAGGTVIAQSEETAEQPSMPLSAMRNGAISVVLPLYDIGKTVDNLARGGPLPRSRTEIEATEALFKGIGEVPRLLRTIDWSRTPLGPVDAWPVPLRIAVRIAIESPIPAIVLWGEDYVQLYNDHYRALMGVNHPEGLGQPIRESWPEVWHLNAPLFARVMEGEPVAIENALYPVAQSGAFEDAWFNLYFAPVRDEAGEVAGIFGTIAETTREVLSHRRLQTLHALTSATTGASSVHEAFRHAVGALAAWHEDLPFTLGYSMGGTSRATLMGATGVAEGGPAAPQTIELGRSDAAWPLKRVVESGAPLLMTDLAERFRGLTVGGGILPSAALLLPLGSSGDERPFGVLVLGIAPRLAYDTAYRGFLELVGAQVEASVAEAQARERERARLEKLAELDRAKTEFFSNVSHEFRTPLTLMLAPLEELIHRRAELPSRLAGGVEAAARNARRLLTLVNTLLDFSRIEEGRMRAHRVPTDLAALTTDVASLFRSAAERAGLRLAVDCPPLARPISVDPEMWEKIVSNLLSNALKFTFEGEIAVELRELPQHLELVVRDTGAGIPAPEIPHLFKRFHQVVGVRSRTQEGSGIGLALVNDLVRLHNGRVRVKSLEGVGSAFTVWIPKGTRPTQASATDVPEAGLGTASTLAEIASRWSTAEEPPAGAALNEPFDPPLTVHAAGARVLVADDNADLRDYLRRLLSPYFGVETVPDGAQALDRLHEGGFDLVLADVKMPRLDGFGLLQAIRDDERLRTTPVVLLTARAGEEAAIEGLLAGADDYLVKPFSARELVARVGGQIELSRARGRAQELNEFLVRFSDAVRGLSDPKAVAQTACRLAAEKLGVERAYWAEVDWTTREYVIGGSFQHEGVPVIEGRFPIDAWEPFTSSHLAGRPVVVDDTQTDPRVPAPVKQSYAQIGVGADLAVPVQSGGRLVCTFAVNQRLSRRWTPEEIALVESVASRCWTEVERARAEAALREREERHAFLLKLSDALRPLSEAADIQASTCRLLGEHLDVDRAYFGEIDEAEGWVRVREHYGRDDSPSMAGTYRLEDYGWSLPIMRRGETVVFDDVRSAEIVPPEFRPALESIQIVAHIAVPLIRDGGLVGILCVTEPASRTWTIDEIELVREVADRLWATFERARAESVVREGEERQAFLLELSDALRAQSDERSIKELTVWMVAEHLRLDRCWFAEVIEREDVARVGPDYHPPDLPPLAGDYRLSEFPGIMRQIATEPMMVDDTALYLRFADTERALLAGLQIRGLMVAPLRKGLQHVVWALVATTAARRQWIDGERALLEEVAERAWATVERARVESAMRRSESKYRTLFEIMDQGYCDLELIRDAEGRAVDQRYLEFNPAFERLFGIPVAKAQGRRASEVFPDLEPWWHDSFDSVVRAGVPERIEHEVRSLGRWYEVHAYPRGGDRLTVTYEDITTRKRAETTLRESEGRYHALAANLPNGAAFVVDRDLRYLLAEGEALRAAGFAPEAFVGRTIHEALDPDLAKAYEPSYRAALEGRSVRTEHSAHGRRFVSHIGPLYDAEGRIYAALAVSYDITVPSPEED